MMELPRWHKPLGSSLKELKGMGSTTRYRVSYPIRPDLPISAQSRGFSIIEIERREDGWIDIRRVGGQAPPAGLLAALLLDLGLVRVCFEKRDGQIIRFELELPEHLRGVPIGYTSRRGRTGAFWSHCWEVGPDGFRIRKLAAWHESMYGKLNEPIGGFPEILFGFATGPDTAGDYIGALRKGLVRVRQDLPIRVEDILGDTVWEAVWAPGQEPEQVAEPVPGAAMEPPPPPPCEGI